MKLDARIAFAAAALALAACSGNFSSGTGMPQGGVMPPVTGSAPPVAGPNGLPVNGASAAPSASPTPPGTYPASEAQKGFTCPASTDGYACQLQFNLPPPTPTPKPGARRILSAQTASPSPSPTPVATPSPAPSGSAAASTSEFPEADGGDGPAAGGAPAGTPSPSPTPVGATVSLEASALPKSAPAMVHTPPNTLDVVPLMMVKVTANGGDFPLNGDAIAQFTLPKDQLEQRGFALQLFSQTTSHRHTSYTPLWTFDKSVLSGNTLSFRYSVSKVTIAKGSTYVIVLYGDDRSKQSPSPAPSAVPSAASGASASPAATATPAE